MRLLREQKSKHDFTIGSKSRHERILSARNGKLNGIVGSLRILPWCGNQDPPGGFMMSQPCKSEVIDAIQSHELKAN